MYRNVASSPDNCSTIPPIVGSAATLSPTSRTVVRSSRRAPFPARDGASPAAGVVQGVRDRISRLHREPGTTVTPHWAKHGRRLRPAVRPRTTHGGRSADHAGQRLPDGGSATASACRRGCGWSCNTSTTTTSPCQTDGRGTVLPSWPRRRGSTRPPTASRRGRLASTQCARPRGTSRFLAPTSAWRSTALPVHDRLGRPEGDWRPVGAPAGPRAWYPRPVSWRDRPRPAA